MQYQRFTPKLFGETALATGSDPQIAQFGSALANTFLGTTDPATIQALNAWSSGFIGAVTPSEQFPPLPETTGALKVFSYLINMLYQQGVPVWDSGTTYYTNHFCSKNGIIYISTSDDNTGNDPETDTTNWKDYVNSLISLDGQWVFSTQLLSSATAIGKYPISLSSYLPNDNYKYAVKVLFKGFRNSGDTDSVISICPTSTVATFETDIGVIPCYAMSEFDGNHAESGNFEAEVIVDTDRIFYYSIARSALSSGRLAMTAYRRLGTNN
jgi:hypothetical protein